MIPIQSGHPAGTIGVTSSDLARYGEFSVSLEGTYVPEGTQLVWKRGVNLARHWNEMIRQLHGEWLWCLNDDHTWDPSTLMRLLDHNVGVVSPLYAARHAPYPPTVIHGPLESAKTYDWNELTEHTLRQLPIGDMVGHAGMLIRRSVLEKMTDPWFEVGQVDSDSSTLDSWFCHKLAALNIPIHVDTSLRLGHLITINLVPTENSMGQLRPHFQSLSKMDR